MQFLPIFLMGRNIDMAFGIDFMFLFWGNLALILVIILIVILQMMTKKPILAVFFGCHQMINRSFDIKKFNTSLCARCTGLLVGVFISLLLTYHLVPFYIYPILALPMIIDGLLQKYRHLISTQPRRFLTGLLFGPMLVMIYSSYNYLILYVISLFR